MSKVAFIMNKPNCCGECPMSGTGVCRNWSMKEAKTFPKECPLLEIPRENEKEYITEFGNSYRDGWNDCIRQIEQERGNCHAGCDRKGTN